MRLYLSADIEGTCGIADWAETERATMDDYRPFAAQMTAEVAAACEGAVAAGAEDILVKDAHDSARNLDAARLPRQARVLRGWTGDPLCMMAGLERGAFGGVLFTGYHAWGCCGGNPLSHTMTTACDQVTLNGVPASEFLINAYTALYFGVPVAFLSGDRELCAFAQDWLPGLVAVPVNEGRGGGVLSMHPQAAVEAIRAGAEEAVRRLRAGGAGAAPPSILARLLLGEQQGCPSMRNEPPVGVVTTQTEYRVRVRMPQAVTCAQLRLVRGYSSVPVPIVMYTGALMVVVAGMD